MTTPDVSSDTIAEVTPLHAWLSQSDWKTDELVDFLRGEGIMPPSFAQSEPFEWVEYALSNAGERPDFETDLARRLGDLLDREPDVNLCWPRPEQVLFNLLTICASMHRPAQLERPLRRMLDRRALKGKYDGIDLRGRLREALASNQSNWDLADTWIGMAHGQIDFLPGSRAHGLSAILLMPVDADDTPPIEAVSAALKGITAWLETHDVGERNRELLRLIDVAKRTFDAGREFIGELLCRACEDNWPGWARKVVISALESAYIEDLCLQVDEEIDEFLHKRKYSFPDERRKVVATMGSMIEVGLSKTDRSAHRRFIAIRKRKLDALNVGAAVSVASA
jgi:hypothetical protein